MTKIIDNLSESEKLSSELVAVIVYHDPKSEFNVFRIESVYRELKQAVLQCQVLNEISQHYFQRDLYYVEVSKLC